MTAHGESGIQGRKGLGQVAVKTCVVGPRHTPSAQTPDLHHLTFGWDTGSRTSCLSLSSNLLGWAVLCKETASGVSPPLLWGQVLSGNQEMTQNGAYPRSPGPSTQSI